MGTKRPRGARGSKLLRVLAREEAEVAGRQAADVAGDRMPCPGLWKTPVIRWDGELMACCADIDGEIPVGNLRDETFEDLWFGEAMTRYRLLHIEGRFGDMPKCWSCGGINFYKLEPAEVRHYLEDAGRGDLWPIYTRRMGLDEKGIPSG